MVKKKSYVLIQLFISLSDGATTLLNVVIETASNEGNLNNMDPFGMPHSQTIRIPQNFEKCRELIYRRTLQSY